MLRQCIPAFSFILAVGTFVQAATVFTATLTNEAENPDATPLTTTTGDPRPTSFGTATFVLNDAQTALTFTATVFNIDFTGSQTPDANDNLTVAHIHGGPAVTPETNGPVIWGFFGAPFNETDPNDQVVTPFVSGVGGTISGKWDATEGNSTTLGEQLSNLFAGKTYINFHTPQFAGGEVRGNITVVPLPPSALAALVALSIASAPKLWEKLSRNRSEL